MTKNSNEIIEELSTKSNRIQKLIVTLTFIFVFTFTSIGYAMYATDLSINNEVTVTGYKSVEISDCTPGSSYNYMAGSGNHNNRITANGVFAEFMFGGTFFNGNMSKVDYTCTITNSTDVDYTYKEFTYAATGKSKGSGPDLVIPAPVISGLEIGDVIEAGSSKNVKITYNYNGQISGEYIFDADTIFEFSKEEVIIPETKILANASNSVYFVKDDRNFNTTLTLANVSSNSLNYHLESSNPDVVLVDINGNPSNYASLINAGDEVNQVIYFKVNPNASLNNGIITDFNIVIDDETTKIETFNIYQDEGKKLLPNAEVKYTWSASGNGSWYGHYDLSLSITNNDTFSYDKWTMYIYLDDKVKITELQNWSDSIEYDPTAHAIKWSSKERYTSSHRKVSPGQTLNTLGNSIVTTENSQLKYKKIVVYGE